jgi:hypothetical protein
MVEYRRCAGRECWKKRVRPLTTTTMLPLRVALVLPALAACCARAQESRGQDSRTRFRDTVLMLESSEPAKIAWGAWNAREDLERKALPHLATALAQSVKIENVLERRCTALVVLDALLALEQTPRLAELEPLLSDAETRRPALALLARSGKDNVAFFTKLLDETRDADERQLAGNVLATTKVPGFAAQALGKVAFAIEVTVTDRDTQSMSSGESQFGVGEPRSPTPAGFPPIPRFRWSAPRLTDGVPVVGTNAPLWLHRTVPGRAQQVGLGSLASEHTLELDWIADLLETRTAKLGIERFTRKGLRWRGAQAFERDLGSLRQTVLDQHSALVGRLVEAKLTTPDEAKALACKVEVLVRDARGDQREPLPQLGFTLLER